MLPQGRKLAVKRGLCASSEQKTGCKKGIVCLLRAENWLSCKKRNLFPHLNHQGACQYAPQGVYHITPPTQRSCASASLILTILFLLGGGGGSLGGGGGVSLGPVGRGPRGPIDMGGDASRPSCFWACCWAE